MSSSAVKNPPNKASNPSVPLATSAWSKGPPQSSATSRAQSPANAPSTPTTQSRRQSTLGQGANAAVKQAPRGVAAGTGHRQASSINFGSIEANQAPEKKAEVATPPPTAPTPATAPAATSKPAPAPVSTATPTATQPSTNGIKVVAPTPTQPMPTSTAPATTTASTGASTAPAAAPTPPGTTPTPSKQRKLDVHALFQGGGPPSVTATPAVPSGIPSTSTPANQPPTAVPPAPRGPASGFSDRNNPAPFPRSPQIGRPPLPGPNTSGGQRPPASPRMNNMPIQQHQQHPMAHPHQHHSPHPGHPMPPAPQWGPTGYYYPPPHDYNPYIYWGGHPPHHMSQIPPMQPPPRTQPPQPRPPSTPPVTNNAAPHTLPPIATNPLQAPSSASSPSLSVNAPTFVPGGLRRPTNPIRISTPGGDLLTFEGVPSSPKVSTPIQPKRPGGGVRMETEQQKNERLAREKEEKERLVKEKEEKERKERERIKEEKRAKEEAERKEKEEAERKAKEEADRKAEEERKIKEEAERKAEEERKAKEEEEKRIAEELRAKEEAERKAKEEEVRKAREEEERKEAERKAREEAERKAKEDEERKAKEEMERKLKEEEERKAKEQAEAKAKEEKSKAEAEAKAKAEIDAAKEEAEAKEAATEEARDTVSASPISSPKLLNGLLPSTIPDRPSPLSNSTTAPGRPSPLSITTSSANERPKRPVPGPLDLTSAQGNRSAAPPSALASARIIEDLNVVPYPETIKTPNPDLNIAATPGKFRYDREFLLQFMNVCKEKPDSLPPLDAIGLEPGEQGAGYPGGARAGGRRVGSMGMGNAPPLQRQGSVGLGLGPGLAKGGFAMGNFQSPSSSQARFDASNAARSGMAFGSGAAGRLTPMSRSASQGGVGGGGPREAKRTRSQRGQHRGDNPRASGFQTPANQPANLEPVVPLEQSENRWVAGSTLRTPQQLEERQLVDRKVKALLNKLTMDKFDSISDQIIEWANKSEQEKDGSTLMQVIKLVFEKAKDEAAFSEMYARLCRKMMERVSPNVQDETIRNSEGQPITGGMLFRKYLLNRCQEDFERGWSAKEAALAAAASKAGEDKAAEAASTENGEAVLYSDEYYAAAKAKRQGLGLVRFIGELFKLQMLTERIMHECIKKLLSNVVNPEEEEIESLCKLLTTVGQSLDNPKARNHMDIYFERMQEMAKGSNVNSRMQFMLQDVIEFRARHWQARSTAPRPPPTHQDSSRDDSGRHGVSRGGSRRGEHRGANATEPDGWNVAGGAGANRPPARAGDLSQFGKISKPTGLQFGPSSVFSKKDANKRDSSIGRASGANMFSALSGGTVDGPPPPAERTTSSRKPSVDLGPGGSPVVAGAGERKKLTLLPRTKPTETDNDKGDGKEEDKEEDKEEAPVALTEEEIQSKVKEDVKEYLGVENIDEAILALEALPSEHRHLFVDKLVNASMDGGNKVVVLTEKLFSAARSRSVISPEGFERGMIPTIEMADDLSIDVPKTYEWLARMIHAAGLDRARAEEMASNISVYGEPPIPPRELLLKEFEKVSSA